MIAGVDYVDTIVRPTGPGDSTQWTPYDLFAGDLPDPPVGNWDCVNGETPLDFDQPAQPGDLAVIAPFGAGPGEKDLYAASHDFPEPILQVELFIDYLAFAIIPPPWQNALRPLIGVNGVEVPGEEILINAQNHGPSNILSQVFQGPFSRLSLEWLQIGIERSQGQSFVFVFRVWAVLRRSKERQRRRRRWIF